MTAESMVSTGSALRHRSALSDSPTCARGPRSNNAADPAVGDPHAGNGRMLSELFGHTRRLSGVTYVSK